MKRTCMTVRIILGALLLGGGLAGAARAAETLFSASDDNLLLDDLYGGSAWALRNWGLFPQLAIGLNAANQPYRSLLRFDLSSLGAETSITSATLTLVTDRVDKLQQANGNFDLRLFLIDQANKAWVQGEKLEYLATEGEPCWRYRQFASLDWAGGPGIGNSAASPGIAALLDTVQVDVTNTVLGTSYTFTVNTPAGLNALTNWAAGGDNAGFLLTTDEGSVTNAQNAIYFGSKENANAARRPKLTVRTATGDVDFGASDDTIIWNSGFTYYSGYNWGQHNLLWAGLNGVNQPYRSLLRFNLAPLRARYNSLDSATLTLTVRDPYKISVALGNFDLRLFLLDDANAGWSEGTTNAAVAVAGDSCWNHLAFDTVNWAGGKGIGNSAASPGVSNLLASVTIDVATVANGQKIVFTLNSPAALAALEAWTRGRTNAGLLLVSDEASGGQNALAFASAEHATSADRPVLAVAYTADETAFTASEDNFLYSATSPSVYANWNWGEWTTRRLAFGLNTAADTYRTLLRFDLSSLERAHKQVKWATLTLTQDDNSKIKPANGAFFDARLFLLSEANAGWTEGTKNGALAGAGESCWNWRQYNTASWTGGPGIGNTTNSAGIAALLATASINANTMSVGSAVTFFIETAEGLAALERWARGGGNPGFLLTTDEASSGQNALLVGSSEHATASRRPTLRVVLEPKIPQGTLIRVN
jgi:hypothetical protein